MGLDCSHDAFHGAYSAFNRLRQVVAHAMGGSFPPHYVYDDKGEPTKEPDSDWKLARKPGMDDEFWYSGEGYSEETHPGLYEFLKHSDCDGEISPEMCVKVANELEALLPKIPDDAGGGHIAARGGYREVVRKFIAGCRAAAAESVPLDFH